MKWKVCGMRDPDNILQVAALEPDYMGFIFYPASPRFMGADFAMPPIAAGIQKTGVFVNESTQNILETARRHQLDLIQLHGHETASQCEEIASSFPVIKAFGIDKSFKPGILEPYRACSYFLFDTATSGFGGSGQVFDWSILAKLRIEKPFFLSGGIDARAAGLLRHYFAPGQVFGLDLNSRFEISPGIKDPAALKRFKHAVSDQ